ncbi:UDP-N-acetylglucosamine-dolichyl-phosphate N-acetylglucosaminephosphotransferase [Planoprotostelium fungivorum]|uniref:UDP-N-acetylglucosamine--dolichyl-phosphate N-acetylglucosaminephosphotransferase n=1 Tax=Planoprotostelium fungivorum TaxID=1890364 RepID=A0A2P6NNC1_9EUKA|nr:UDP-N-acetylglucosamine-dolichyl-phosphate N-acetylglucosaminephosphotransferase [Planoprotostelium fungivorum]
MSDRSDRFKDSIKFLSVCLTPVFLSLCILAVNLKDRAVQFQLACLVLLSIGAFFATIRFIPIVGPMCLKRGLGGKDINKGGDTPVPESLGIVSGTIYLVVIMMFQPILSSGLTEYNAALTGICFMMLLGFADDVLDLRWSVKIGLSFLSTLPLLVSYTGSTFIVVPVPLVPLIGHNVINLGLLYHVYIAFFSVFTTNSINILAGLNGLEAGQTIIITISMLIHGIIQYTMGIEPATNLASICMTVPFIATTAALLYYNWYPSKCFVGDTFTYQAGMTLAVIGIMGHSTKTLMLFFIPQLINFTISLPQLFGIIPCPRHRLPKLNRETGKLECIKTNWNLINLFLFILGPMSEKHLCSVVLWFQVFCNVMAFFIRYYVSTWVY